MDAFSVSLVNGLKESGMKKRRMCLIAGTFALFQAFMPLLGYCFVHTILKIFTSLERWIPWIAFALLLVIGVKMIYEGARGQTACENFKPTGFRELILLGIATSIDALSVGFTIAEYNLLMALICALIIAIVTFFLCFFGIVLGKKIGTKLSDKAQILGGLILIAIGLEIVITSLIR